MNKVNNIIANRDYQLFLQKNEESEKERIFCNHHFDHLLAVARLTYILILEEGNPFISREMAYAAGLLHDIGRWQEYETGSDHAAKSALLAQPILIEAGFPKAEREIIGRAIKQHRLKEECHEHRSPLSTALSKADELSRLCFQCKVTEQCNKLEKQLRRNKLAY